MNKLLENKGVKVVCVYVNPILIGILIPIAFETRKNQNSWFYGSLIGGIVLLILYIYTSYAYDKAEKNKDKEKNELQKEINKINTEKSQLEREVNSFDRGMRELATLCYDSSNSLNKLSEHILKGDVALDIWSFKKVATGICNSIYNLLCETCAPYDDFTVNIMLSDVTATGNKRNITMIAHKGKYEKYPGKFEEKLYFTKYSSFYAVKLCKSNNTDIRILTTKEEVNEKFVYVDEDHPDYSQYVGIPIVCSGNKIVCLLQICAFGNSKIAESKAEILKIIKKYIFPFTHYALLAYKVEKGLVSSFSMISKQEENRNGEK